MKKIEEKLKSELNSNKKTNKKVLLKRNVSSTSEEVSHSLKDGYQLDVRSLDYKHKIKKLKREGIYVLKKNNPNLAPPMNLALHNLKDSWLYKKKRIERKNIYERFVRFKH